MEFKQVYLSFDVRICVADDWRRLGFRTFIAHYDDTCYKDDTKTNTDEYEHVGAKTKPK